MTKFEEDISHRTDNYFKKSKFILSKKEDVRVTYAIFMRRPVIFCPELALEWIKKAAGNRNTKFDIYLCHKEGSWVGAGEPLMYLSGSFSKLVDLETIYLQLLGPPCVAAYNAFNMCIDLPNTSFLAMEGRHCAGKEMHEIMAYGASVGSLKAVREVKAKGFIGSSSDSTSKYFGKNNGMGTMPHAMIGYAGNTVDAAEMFYECFPKENLTVLIDYFGREITDALAVCKRFKKLANEGKLSLRIDTHGGRYVEGLDIGKSYEVLESQVPDAIRTFRTEQELKWMVGTGVSAASIWHLRLALNNYGWDKVKIIASSGFTPAKCKLFSTVKAPVDMIGTGSYLPENWSETYATADIIKYNGKTRVKVGREFLLPNKKEISL